MPISHLVQGCLTRSSAKTNLGSMTVANKMREKLEREFNPQHIQLDNESHRHHSPKEAESHFKLLMVTASFETLTRIQRHQRVNQVLAEELAGPVHALTMKLLTPAEWEALPEEERKFKAIGHHPKGDHRRR